MTQPEMPSIFPPLGFAVYGPADSPHLNWLENAVDDEGFMTEAYTDKVRATRPASPEEFRMYCLMASANSQINMWMAEKVLEFKNMTDRLSDYDVALHAAVEHATELARVPLEQRMVELKRLTGKVIGVSSGR
jgi:hypothetical protein